MARNIVPARCSVSAAIGDFWARDADGSVEGVVALMGEVRFGDAALAQDARHLSRRRLQPRAGLRLSAEKRGVAERGRCPDEKRQDGDE